MITQAEFKEAFSKRAKSVLFNPEEITDEALDVATHETYEECNGRVVKSWAMMDFALIRLKLYLKIAISEEDSLLLSKAISEIKASPLESKPTFNSFIRLECV